MRVAIAIAVLLVAVGGCSGRDFRLERKIATEVEDNAGAAIRLEEITDYRWDRFFVFGAYSTPEMVEEELGFAWAEAPPATTSEIFMLLVFVENKSVVGYVIQDCKKADFRGLVRPGGYTPDQAVFKVVDHGSGLLVRYELTLGSSE